MSLQLKQAWCEICNFQHPHGGSIEAEHTVGPDHFALCPSCEIKVDQGYIAAIGIDPKLSSDSIPFRTGILMWIQLDKAMKLFNTDTLAVLTEQHYIYADPMIVTLLKALEAGAEEESAMERFCELCERRTGPAIDHGCDKSYHPKCAWHIKN